MEHRRRLDRDLAVAAIVTVREMLWRSALAGGVASAASLALGLSSVEAASPSISLSPTTGTPATVVQVKGSGFCAAPCSAAQIVFQGTPVATDIAVASDGTFTATFQPSAGPPGWKTVIGQQRDAQGTWISSTPAAFYLVLAPPTPTPTSFPHPSSPPPGSSSSPSAQPQPSDTNGQGSPASTGASPAVSASTVAGLSPWLWLAIAAALAAGVILLVYLSRGTQRRR